MLVGYVRVSCPEQETARQDELMERLGVEKIYTDKVSGKNANRPELKAMLDFIREGDTVIVESISRLARSTKDLLNIISLLEEKKVAFISKKESIDTSTPQGKFMLTVFGAMAELERETILERQREGIEIAKRQHKYKGRKPIEIDEKEFRKVCAIWRNGEITAVEAMKRLNLKTNTFYKAVKTYKV